MSERKILSVDIGKLDPQRALRFVSESMDHFKERTVQKVDLAKDFVEIRLKDDEDFLIIKETLTRIGVASPNKHELFQTCHILHKQGKLYIVHFKQMFALDGKTTNFDEEDKSRLNGIVNLLLEWGLIELVNPEQVKTPEPMSVGKKLKVISSKDKANWTLKPKYNIGRKKG